MSSRGWVNIGSAGKRTLDLKHADSSANRALYIYIYIYIYGCSDTYIEIKCGRKTNIYDHDFMNLKYYPFCQNGCKNIFFRSFSRAVNCYCGVKSHVVLILQYTMEYWNWKWVGSRHCSCDFIFILHVFIRLIIHLRFSWFNSGTVKYTNGNYHIPWSWDILLLMLRLRDYLLS